MADSASGGGMKDVSAFFISTADRADKSAFFNRGNAFRMATKTALLALNIGMVLSLTDVDKTGAQAYARHPRRALVCLFSVVFVGRVLTQMFM